MKKQTLQLAALSLLLMFAATVAQAQAKITVKVPFNFLIFDRTFPAGQYSVSSSSGLLTMQDSSGKPIFIGFVYPVGGRHAGATGQIVFHCYDENDGIFDHVAPPAASCAMRPLPGTSLRPWVVS